jgi:hypothetical protein
LPARRLGGSSYNLSESTGPVGQVERLSPRTSRRNRVKAAPECSKRRSCALARALLKQESPQETIQMTTKLMTFPMVLALMTGCSSGGANGAEANGAEANGGMCQYTVTPHIDFSSCTSDNECFSGYCCISGKLGCGRQGTFPGYCTHPTTSAFNAGHGYSCKTDQDCIDIQPDLVATGVTPKCHYDSINGVSNGCSFDCKYR